MTEKRKQKIYIERAFPSQKIKNKKNTLKPAEIHPRGADNFPKAHGNEKHFILPQNMPAERSGWLLPTSQYCKSKCPMGIILHYLSNLCHQCTDRSGGKMKSVYIVSVG